MSPLSLPSPSFSQFHLGPVTIHAYALCILAGIAIAWTWSRRRFVSRGGQGEQFENIAALAVVFGIIGARVYHVLTDPELYFGAGRHPIRALYIWQGGLGIWGAVAGGALGAWVMARRYHLPFGDLADVIAPGLLVAQAVGRLGNWFNQELFGRPTTLPWGLRIAPQYRPDGYARFTTFHPTFLYELVWNLLACVVLLLLERRWRLGRGSTFCAYVALYTFGRFFIERVRIDHANSFGGLRLNDWTCIIVFSAAVACLLRLRRRGLRRADHPFAAPEPAVPGGPGETGVDPDAAGSAGTDPSRPTSAGA